MRSLLAQSVTAILFAGFLPTQAITGPKTEPVMLDADPNHGTCSDGWQVNADGAELRAGPGAEYPLIAVVPEGKVFAGCDTHGDWEGVIDGQSEFCSIGIMLTVAQPYEGPCSSGWIELRFLTHIYG